MAEMLSGGMGVRGVLCAVFLCAVAVGGARADWELVWSDEFDGTQIDPANWTHQIGTGTSEGLPPGWGNNELQYYTSRVENSRVENGVLRIIARNEFFGGRSYTSARLRSLNKADFAFGRFEARAKVPSTTGIWPAIWMLPSTDVYGIWAASGELDIMESVNIADRIYGTAHFGAPWPGQQKSGGVYDPPGVDFSQDFHVYAMEWDPDEIRWYCDGVLYHTLPMGFAFSTNASDNPRAPFDVPFHLLMNVAVGGDWPGSPDGSSVFPAEMQVDYVRVYQRDLQDPYTGEAAAVPGRVEMEEYDTGGQGVAYNEADSANNGGAFRPSEAVDIQATSGGGFNVGWVREGEWIEYSVDVDRAGTYRIDARVASDATGGVFHLELDGEDVSGAMVVPVTGGWQSWALTSIEGPIALTGERTLRFVNDSVAGEEYNIDWVEFTLLAEAGDVNADGSVDIDDLHALESGVAAYGDVDLDGVAGTAGDRAALIEVLRADELQDMSAR